MTMSKIHAVSALAILAAVTVWLAGCNQGTTDSEGEPSDATDTSHEDHEGHEGHDHGEDGQHAHGPTHGGWWCYEHGIPEEECSMCSADFADKCKAKGDWCEEHNRADSQCFICHPELQGKFAALYQAKYGEEPPKPTD